MTLYREIAAAHIAACPKHVLVGLHYYADGMCACRERSSPCSECNGTGIRNEPKRQSRPRTCTACEGRGYETVEEGGDKR